MRINPQRAIPQTVTIINKVKKADSGLSSDIWVKHTLDNCVWQVSSVASQNGITTNLGEKITIHIPTRQKVPYLAYNDFTGAYENSFTVSMNDYIVLGEVTETITSDNITRVMQGYGKNACKVQLFEDLSLPNGSYCGNGFLQQYASMYYIEGV